MLDINTYPAESIAQLVPNYLLINKKISLHLGFKPHSLMLPPPAEKEVWVLRDSDNYIWYRGSQIAPQKDAMVEMEAASSEEEMWQRDNADYYRSLSLAFSLLANIPYHSMRLINVEVDNETQFYWEITYRETANGLTKVKTGRFITVLIINALLECHPEIVSNN